MLALLALQWFLDSPPRLPLDNNKTLLPRLVLRVNLLVVPDMNFQDIFLSSETKEAQEEPPEVELPMIILAKLNRKRTA